MPPPPHAYDVTLRLTRVALALWCSLSSLEAIVAATARSPGPAVWEIASLRRDRSARWLRSSPLASPIGLVVVPSLRLAAGLGLAFVADILAIPALLAIILASTAAMSFSGAGSNGADKIAMVACVAAALISAGRALGDVWLCLAGLAWGAGQLTIAYFTSGAAKLVQAIWRDGTALAAAMTSYRSGHAVMAPIVEKPARAKMIAWSVMLPEVLFPLAMLSPAPICLCALAGFCAFHFATAWIMGLNTYPWAFMTTYPCALMANQEVAYALWRAG